VQRVTSFLLAFIIFMSAIVSAVFVVQQIRKEQNPVAANTTTTDTSANPDQTNNPAEQPAETPKEGQLKGTQLANFTPTTDRLTDVKIEDITVGVGAEAAAGSTVTAHYTGAQVADGKVFESSKDSGKTFTAPLSNLIKGWQTGIPGMKVGGVRRLTIPAALAYGDDASSGRPYGDLVFDIELFEVK
jgi:FKBP-type peptidyl-prolyl cis-trans isomerase